MSRKYIPDTCEMIVMPSEARLLTLTIIPRHKKKKIDEHEMLHGLRCLLCSMTDTSDMNQSSAESSSSRLFCPELTQFVYRGSQQDELLTEAVALTGMHPFPGCLMVLLALGASLVPHCLGFHSLPPPSPAPLALNRFAQTRSHACWRDGKRLATAARWPPTRQTAVALLPKELLPDVDTSLLLLLER